jgi:hypothetical protein
VAAGNRIKTARKSKTAPVVARNMGNPCSIPYAPELKRLPGAMKAGMAGNVNLRQAGPRRVMIDKISDPAQKAEELERFDARLKPFAAKMSKMPLTLVKEGGMWKVQEIK